MSEPIRVLLVEDNPADADLTRETLEGGSLTLEISEVRDGAEALDYLLHRGSYAGRADLPDLVVLDLNLPKLDGRQVLAELKRQPDLTQLPVVVLSSSEASADILRSYQLGARCYVTKPVGLAAFQSVVRSIESFWLSVARLPRAV